MYHLRARVARYVTQPRMLRVNVVCVLVLLTTAACAPSAPAISPTPSSAIPRILSVSSREAPVGRYEKLELIVELEADYDNPYDVSQVDLHADFIAPSGQKWHIPGFWDARDRWRIRFAPAEEGDWRYQVGITDQHGTSVPWEGHFQVAPSPYHGWLQVASWVNPDYSPHYLAYHDGTPFYGIGHCQTFNLLAQGLDAHTGELRLFREMARHGENMVVYWVSYSSPFWSNAYDDYSAGELAVLDMVLRDAERQGIFLIFTVWDHTALRDETHPWGDPRWKSNVFSKLTNLRHFFAASGDDPAWRWQENLYRYMIARWGHSRALGLWQTVSEIDGTNAYGQTDAWHTRVNDYFARNDPYRHPTTASKAGDQPWPRGWAVMDVPQVHSYDTMNDAVRTGRRMAEWSRIMWETQAKPNVVGEFGTPDGRLQPDHLHNGIWGGLAGGAAITPLDWNDGSTWGDMTLPMLEQMASFAHFVEGIPFAHLPLAPLNIQTEPPGIEAWGMGTEQFAFIWVQDTAPGPTRNGVHLTVSGLEDVAYQVLPYDTWQGKYLPPLQASVVSGRLTIVLPPFAKDLALKIRPGARSDTTP
ncbi:MAG TPA: DUF5060 domain-containing protein [Anaerolineae bacterium]|nr:DUF5060 domain-containing protein [Anaerolineae bacterium]